MQNMREANILMKGTLISTHSLFSSCSLRCSISFSNFFFLAVSVPLLHCHCQTRKKKENEVKINLITPREE